MILFGTLLSNSLRAYRITVNDNPFDMSPRFGMDSDHAFIPFDTTTGTVVHSESRVPTEWKRPWGQLCISVHLESRVPTEWEKTHLPIILLTSEDWNPSQEVLRDGESRESKKMRTIHSSGMSRRQMNAIRGDEAQGERPEDN
jgi:hypothetical protein